MEGTLAFRTAPAPRRAADLRLRALDDFITSHRFLPASFELVPRLLLLLDDPTANCEKLADIIRVDPNLTANIFRIANSVSHGGARRIEKISEAIARVGLREVYRVVMEIVTSPALKAQDVFASQRVDLWRHSLATAVAAQTLARHLTEEDPEVAFTAALLHDVGKALFSRAAGADYFQLLQMCLLKNDPVWQAERDEFEIDHGVVGGRLLRAWKFPTRIAGAVAEHHAPWQAPHEQSQLAALVHVGNILAYRIGEGNGYPLYVVYPDQKAFELISLHPDDLASYEDEVRWMLLEERARLS